MRIPILCGLFLTVLSTALAQQPVIRPNSVVNAASYLQPGLPNHGVAQGGMFILKGQGLGARGTVVANVFPMGTTMGGTSMKITVAGTTVNALMIYVVAGQPMGDQFGPVDQLAGIAPSNTPAGTGSITVTYNGQTSAPAAITIVPSVFGIFTINQGGTGPGVFTDPNFKVNTLTSAAHTGDLLFIWGTGLGPISASDAGAPPVGNLNVPVEVYVGNQKATVTYQGRSGCCAGIDQILFTVPPGVQGCYVSVAVRTGSVVSNFATVSIAPSGNVCSDPAGFTTSELQKVQSGGSVTIADTSVSRFSANFSFPGMSNLRGNLDQGEGHFRRYQPGAVLGSTRGSIAGAGGFPSAGCIVFPFTPKQGFFDNVFPGANDPAQGLDAGPSLNIAGPLGSKQIPRSASPQSPQTSFEYTLQGNNFLGGGVAPVTPVTPEYLAPGSYTIDNGSGGPDVGSFSGTITIPSDAVVWTNQDAISNISRSQDLTVSWTGGGSGLVGIEGSSANPAAQAGAEFHCGAASGGGSFTVPAWVLSALPASGMASDVPAPIGFLAVGGTLSSPARFQARGIGYFNWGLLQVRNVNYQ